MVAFLKSIKEKEINEWMNAKCLSLLESEGFRFYRNGEFKELDYRPSDFIRYTVKAELLDHLSQMSLKMQVALDKLLLDHWSKTQGLSMTYKRNYYELYKSYVYDPFDYEKDTDFHEMQKDFLNAVKEGDVESPVNDFFDISTSTDMEIVLKFLKANIPNFNYWYINDSIHKQFAFVWNFNKFDEADFMKPKSGHAFSDLLSTVTFS